jgi:hypothetical protein
MSILYFEGTLSRANLSITNPSQEAGRKIFIPHRDLFDRLVEAMLSHASGNEKELLKIGNPTQLKEVVAFLCKDKGI